MKRLSSASNIIRAKWLNHNVISNNSFWLVIYAWKKTAWNAPRKEIFGSNIFRHFRKPRLNFFAETPSSLREILLVKRWTQQLQEKWERNNITQLNSEIPQKICIWFSSAEQRKNDDLFQSFALTGFCESLNIYFQDWCKWLPGFVKKSLHNTPP